MESAAARDLAKFAAHALRPGGLLLAIVPHPYLPRVLAEMTAVKGLEYRWLGWYRMPGSRQSVHSSKVVPKGKPLVIFTRDGARPGGRYPLDEVTADQHDASHKADHDWGQDPAGLVRIIEQWVHPFVGAVICDPFLGAGSTLVAALSLGHRIVGADVDAGCVAVTAERLENVTENGYA